MQSTRNWESFRRNRLLHLTKTRRFIDRILTTKLVWTEEEKARNIQSVAEYQAVANRSDQWQGLQETQRRRIKRKLGDRILFLYREHSRRAESVIR